MENAKHSGAAAAAVVVQKQPRASIVFAFVKWHGQKILLGNDWP
jgi:hypothetical protein